MSIKSKISELAAKHKELFDKIGLKLSVEEAPVALVMAAEGELKDGTKIYTTSDSFAVESDVFIKDETGADIPAPDGEHTSSDGKIFVVASGKITEIKDAMPEDMSAEETAQVIEQMAEKLAEYEGKLSAVTVERDQLKADKGAIELKLTEANKKVKLLEAKPAAEVVTTLKKEEKSGEAKSGTKDWFKEKFSTQAN